MCGIAGFITTTKEGQKLAGSKITPLLLELQTRGKDATGLMLAGSNFWRVLKAPQDADKFTLRKDYQSLINKYAGNAFLGILHARQATKGLPEQLPNNHPIFDRKTGLVIAHNGIISNDTDIQEKYHLNRDGMVDSEIILRLFQHFNANPTAQIAGLPDEINRTAQTIKRTGRQLSGSLAVAMYNRNLKNCLWLFRDGSPLSLAYHEESRTMFFASTASILEDGLTENIGFFGGMFTKTEPLPLAYTHTQATSEKLYCIEKTPDGLVLRNWKFTGKPYGFYNKNTGIIGSQTNYLKKAGYKRIDNPKTASVLELESRVLYISDHHPLGTEKQMSGRMKKELRRIYSSLIDRTIYQYFTNEAKRELTRLIVYCPLLGGDKVNGGTYPRRTYPRQGGEKTDPTPYYD
jgi:predicted glutamine amidotransferase